MTTTEDIDLDREFCDFILPKLNILKNCEESAPAGTDIKEWEDIINSMILGFSVYKENKSSSIPKETQLALSLFATNFNKLWS